MEKKKFFITLMAAMMVVIVGAVLTAPSSAEILSGWAYPIDSLEGDTIEAGSPYAFLCYREASEDYTKILVFIEGNGEKYTKVPMSGYYWMEPSGRYVAYSLWIPQETPTGEYTLKISLQSRVWVYDSDSNAMKPWGPWQEKGRYAYTINVYGYEENDDSFVGSCSTNGCAESASFSVMDSEISLNAQSIDGIEKLNAGQRKVLLKTLEEELSQRGVIT